MHDRMSSVYYNDNDDKKKKKRICTPYTRGVIVTVLLESTSSRC